MRSDLKKRTNCLILCQKETEDGDTFNNIFQVLNISEYIYLTTTAFRGQNQFT